MRTLVPPLVLLSLIPATVRGQAPAGAEFQVNTYTTSNQNTDAAAMDASGNFVVVWQSYGQDGSGKGVYAQRYNAAGVAQGGEFRVNTSKGVHFAPVGTELDGMKLLTYRAASRAAVYQ